MDRGLAVAREAFKHVGQYIQDLRAVDRTLRPSDEAPEEERKAQFVVLWQEWESSADPAQPQLATVMSRLAPGLCVGGEAADFPEDHVDVERWCKRPKGHERRMHGERHVGVRLVRQGAAPTVALDGHVRPDG